MRGGNGRAMPFVLTAPDMRISDHVAERYSVDVFNGLILVSIGLPACTSFEQIYRSAYNLWISGRTSILVNALFDVFSKWLDESEEKLRVWFRLADDVTCFMRRFATPDKQTLNEWVPMNNS